MPYRRIAAKELGALLGVLSHPGRLQIVEELHQREQDVNSLQETLGISHSGVSQHLNVLRSHRIVLERREGRHVFYRLRRPELASWLVEGLAFIAADRETAESLSIAVEAARERWQPKPPEPDPPERATPPNPVSTARRRAPKQN